MKLIKKIKKWFYIPLKPIYITVDDYRFVCFIKLENAYMGVCTPETLVFSRDFKELVFITYIDNILNTNKSKHEVRRLFEIPIKIVKRMKELENNEIV